FGGVAFISVRAAFTSVSASRLRCGAVAISLSANAGPPRPTPTAPMTATLITSVDNMFDLGVTVVHREPFAVLRRAGCSSGQDNPLSASLSAVGESRLCLRTCGYGRASGVFGAGAFLSQSQSRLCPKQPLLRGLGRTR